MGTRRKNRTISRGSRKRNLFRELVCQSCRKIDIDSLASWGFNAIRLPMHYNLFTLSIQEEPVPGQNTWLTKGFEMTDSLGFLVQAK